MKIHSTFLYLSLCVTISSPTLSHAQVTLPVWLQPTWIQAKLMGFHEKNTERFDVAQANTANSNGRQVPTSTNNGTVNTSANTHVAQPQFKQTANLAPVETAVPKLNEKHLTAEELKELRKQLRQPR